MQKRAARLAAVAAVTAIPLAILWANPLPPAGRTGAPGDTTCASCHGGAGGGGSVTLGSTSGMTSYTPGASKRFTVTVNGSTGNAGFELTARPASNLSGGVAGSFVAGTNTNVTCRTGTACGTGNPQYIRSSAAVAGTATWTFDWTAPAGSENVTLYIAAARGYSGNTYTASYTLTASGGGTAPTLSATPASLSFSYQIGGPTPAAQTIAVSGVASTFTAAASGGTWLSGTAAASSVSVSANPAGLAAGSYTGSVTITAPGSTGSPKTIPVTLSVTPATPNLTVTPGSLTFTCQTAGGSPTAQTLSVSGVGSSFTAAGSGETWLSAAPSSGVLPGVLFVSVNPGTLATGTYKASVRVTSTGSAGGTMTIPVTMTVISPTNACPTTRDN